jgi:hypothetical protein
VWNKTIPRNWRGRSLAYLDRVNKTFGVCGRTFELIAEHGQGKPVAAPSRKYKRFFME